MPKYAGVKARKDQAGFEAFVRLKMDDGRWVTRRAYGRTPKEAFEAKNQILADHAEGIVRNSDIVTLADMARHWLRSWRATNPDAEQNTDDDYAYAVDMICAWMGDIRLDTPPRKLIELLDIAFVRMLTRGRRKVARGSAPRPVHPARHWAMTCGMPVPRSGRLPADVLDAWVSAGSPSTEVANAEPILWHTRSDRDWNALPQAEKDRYRLSNMTVLGVRTKLAMICDQAVLDGYMRVSPVRHLKRIERKPSKEKVAFTDEQVSSVAEALSNWPLDVQVRWAAALSLALRQGEVLALRWSKLDFQQMTALIDTAVERRDWRHGCEDPAACDHREPGRQHRSVTPGYVDVRYKKSNTAARCPQRHSGGLVLKSTKEDDHTTVPLSAPLVSLLKQHRKAQAEERLRAGERWQDNDLVFCSPTGGPIDPRRDWERWQKLLVQHGLPRDAGTHSAKHTSVTIAFDAGVDELVVSKLLARHKSGVAFTRSHYQHLRGRKKAGDMLRETMGSAVFGQQT